MPSNCRDSPSRAEILESEQEPGMEENTQKRCHAAPLNVVPHGGCGSTNGHTASGAVPTSCRMATTMRWTAR